jgi:hypothetical protein
VDSEAPSPMRSIVSVDATKSVNRIVTTVA